MNNIDDMLQYMIPDLPGCPIGVMKQNLRKSLREFCVKTEAWRSKQLLDAVEDETEYDLRGNFDALVQRIIAVKQRVSSSQDFYGIIATNVSQYELVDDSTLLFRTAYAPQVTLSEGIQVEIAWRPHYEAEELSGAFVDRYAEGIIAYAKYTLMKMPQKAWSDPQSAGVYLDQYNEMREEAIREKDALNKSTDVSVIQLGGVL